MWQYNPTNYLSHANGYKYVAKVKSNGRTRYFYSQAAYNSYLKNKQKEALPESAKVEGIPEEYLNVVGEYNSDEVGEYASILDMINGKKMTDTEAMKKIFNKKQDADREVYIAQKNKEAEEANNRKPTVRLVKGVLAASAAVSSIASSTVEKGSDFVKKLLGK